MATPLVAPEDPRVESRKLPSDCAGFVANKPPAPIEWVRSEQKWWIPRLVIPVVVVVVLAITLALEFVYGHPWSATTLGWIDALIFGVLAVEFAFIYLYPSVRRLGISPDGLIVDVGFRKIHYPWSQLTHVTRIHVNRFRWTAVSSISRTRISVGSGLTQNYFTLSTLQGERLARFLQLP